MRNIKNVFGVALIAIFTLTSCINDKAPVEPPTAAAFKDLKDKALENITQNFQFNADDGSAVFTSENGVQININANCLSSNGNAVTGMVDIEYVEIFNKGNMLNTNKPTMGLLPNGDKAMLISGGEFFLEASQNGTPLTAVCGYDFTIPTELTGGADLDMTAWKGVIDADDNLVWEEELQGGIEIGDSAYYSFFQSFGWNNVDRFYDDARPKTTIQVAAPDGYDNKNSQIFLSYDGEDSGLANLDTYDATTGLFSEHYGQVPIGLECHIIFATEDDEKWKYAIQGVTITENTTYTFSIDDMTVATEDQIKNVINALP